MNKKLYFFTLVLALAFIAVACTPKEQKEVTDTLTEDKMMKTEEVNVTLSAQNSSGQSGTAKLTRENNQTRVVINLKNAPSNIAQPAHIHLSSCATIGGVKYPLTSLINGASDSLVPADLDDLLKNEQLSVNIHRSAAEASVYVACGDLSAKGEMQAGDDVQDDTMMKDDTAKDDTMMGDDSKTEDGTMMDGNTDDDSKSDNSAMMPATKVFNVSGSNFAFDVKEIKVKKGDKVKINFTSASGFHDLIVDAFNARTSRVNTGESSSVEFTADKTGTFEYYCSVGTHRQLGMVGKLMVE